MRAYAAVMFTLLVVAGLGWVAFSAISESRRKKAIAVAPEGSGVLTTDSKAVAKAKTKAYERHLRAIRLLAEVKQADTYLTFLPNHLRKEIDEVVDQFYGKG